jgi:hypothetical protein
LAAFAVRDIVFRLVPQIGGPLGVEAGTIEGANRSIGTRVTFGIFLENQTSSVATLDGIRLIGSQPGLRIVGEGVTRSGWVGAVDGYPPPRLIVEPVSGAPIANTTSHPTQLLIGVIADRPGRYDVAGVEVSYHVASQPYRAVILQGFSLCASGGAVQPRCNALGAVTRAQETLSSLLFPDQS